MTMVSINKGYCENHHPAVPCVQEIDLVESLCGFKRVITTLDKRSLLVISPVGDVIKDGIFIFELYAFYNVYK